jgi:hypothetical protein
MTDRNPLIEKNPEDTLLNLHTVLTLVHDLHSHDQFIEIQSQKNMNIAISLILKCTNDALEYEMNRIELRQNNVKSYQFEA